MKKNILKQLFIVLLCTFAVNNFLFAQDPEVWSAENSFNIKNVFELYDERGFSKNMETALDGNLMVNPVNGNLGYSYKVNEVTISDRKISMDLNYCGAVSFSSFSIYQRFEEYWERFHQNRPVWILSVNNFAVQVFGRANYFLCNPLQQETTVGGICTVCLEELEDKNVTWVIDGYEVCNSMSNIFYKKVNGQYYENDVIKILRGDGSILELRNSFISYTNDSDYDNQRNLERVTGIYYENGVNTKGYAIVEFVDDLEIPTNLNIYNTEEGNEGYNVRIRKLKYYPGDGLEYIFYEDVAPWGFPTQDYFKYMRSVKGYNDYSLGDWSTSNSPSDEYYNAYSYTTPTIFYLREIKAQGSQGLCTIVYSKEFEEFLTSNFGKLFFNGRQNFSALILNNSSIDDNKSINMGGLFSDYVEIKGLGKQTNLLLTKEAVISGVNLPVNENGYTWGSLKFNHSLSNLTFEVINPNEKKGCITNENKKRFASWLKYISKIEERKCDGNGNPQGEKNIYFDYEPVSRIYHFKSDLRFPVPYTVPGGTGGVLELKNSRLSEIFKEDGTKQRIDYFSFETEVNEIQDDIYGANSPPNDIKSYSLINNVVKKITTTDFINDKILKTEEYSAYYFDTGGLMLPGPCGSKLSTTFYNDGVAQQEKYNIDRIYKRSSVEPPYFEYNYNPSLVQTALCTLEVDDNKFITKTITEGGFLEIEPQTPTNIFVDKSKLVEVEDINDPSSHILQTKSYSAFDYDISRNCNFDELPQDLIREYTELNETAPYKIGNFFGNEIIQSNTKIYKPSDYPIYNSEINNYLYRIETEYGHLPLEVEKINGDLPKFFWQYFPQILGLEKKKVIFENNNTTEKILGGEENIYQVIHINEQNMLFISRGKILQNKQIGKSGIKELIKNLFVYQAPSTINTFNYEDGRLKEVINANGATNINLYSYDASEYDINLESKILTDKNNIFTEPFSSNYLYKDLGSSPCVTINKVRKWNESSSSVDLNYITNIFKYDYSNFGYNELPIGIIDPNGWQTSLFYDPLKRLKKVILPYDFADPDNTNEYIDHITEAYCIAKCNLNKEYDGLYYRAYCCSINVMEYGERNIYHQAIWYTGYYNFHEAKNGNIIGWERTYIEPIDPKIQRDPIYNNKNDICGYQCGNPFDLDAKVHCNCVPPIDEEDNCMIFENVDINSSLNDAKYNRCCCDHFQNEHQYQTTYLSNNQDYYNRETTFVCNIGHDSYGLENIIHILSITDAKLKLQFNYVKIDEVPCKLVLDIELNVTNPPQLIKKVIYFNDLNAPILIDNDIPPNYQGGICDPVTNVTRDPYTIDLNPYLSTYQNQIVSILNTEETDLITIRAKLIDLRGDLAAFNTDCYVSFSPPSLSLKGSMWKNRFESFGDFSVLYEYQKVPIGTTNKYNVLKYINKFYKIDDNWHSANVTNTNNFVPRRMTKRSYIAPYYNISNEERLNNFPKADDFTYYGNGLPKESSFEFSLFPGDNTPKKTITEYDGASDRVKIITYADGSHIDYNYELIDPSNFIGQEFYGYCYKKTFIDQRGIHSYQYYDAFDRLRREEKESNKGGTAETVVTEYEYDLLGRLTKVTNPEEQVYRYWYDDFGRVKYKYHPDMNVQSYTYDDVGNLRFYQTQEQSDNDRLTFYQYDDLNRIKIMGEAKIYLDDPYDPNDIPLVSSVSINLPNDLGVDELNLNRITDQLNPNYLHMGSDNPEPKVLTYNKTIFWDRDQDGYIDPPLLPDDISLFDNCVPSDYVTINNELGGESYPKPPLIMHAARKHDYRFEWDARNYENFEHIQWHPDQVLIAYHYDELPIPEGYGTGHRGTIWKEFEAEDWNAMAPLGEVRNLKGKISAIAYRETGTQPYNYMVFSYDERGRIEALMRYTDNLGYDAVYYTYNSMNLVTSVQTIDPIRSYITYYSYDDAARIDKVWTELLDDENAQKGLCIDTDNGSWQPDVPKYPFADIVTTATNLNNPNAIKGVPINDINYTYNSRDLIESMAYPQIDVNVDYEFNERLWVDNIVAYYGNHQSIIFSNQLSFCKFGSGLIKYEDSYQNNKSIFYQAFDYDSLSRLSVWHNFSDNIYNEFVYDKIGNRQFVNKGGTSLDLYSYSNGNNSLTSYQKGQKVLGINPPLYFFDSYDCYNYNPNGALITSWKNWLNQAEKWDAKYEDFKYDTRVLPERYLVANYFDQESNSCEIAPKVEELTEWHYKYNPMNEREQKRMYERAANYVSAPGIMAAKGPISQFFPRAYYLLGWNNEQFAVYYGAEYEPAVQSINCVGGGTANITSDGPRTVLMWNAEYNTYGNGSNINLTYKYDQSEGGTWKKYYNINDHLGNVRTVLREENNQPATIVKQFDYAPFGAVLNSTDINRTKFIGKEKDKESNYADHGVRKYDDEIGRFTSIDPLWEKYYSLTPYQYAGNNPVIAKDADGEAIDVVLDVGFILYDVYDIGKSLFSGEGVTWTQIGALGSDVACAATPFATGGGIAFRAASKADDAVKAAKVAEKASDTKKATEGIYEFTAKSGNTYVGESGNVEKRINQHIKSGKVTPENASKAIIKEVSGGKNVRRVAEQKRINTLRGIKYLDNKINSISQKYWNQYGIHPPK